MKLYILRHGEIETNKKNCMTGIKKEISLSETGKKQAEEIKEKISNLEYDLVLCSPLTRAKETCEIVNGAKNKEVFYEDRLLERDSGILEGRSKSFFDYSSYWNYNKEVDFKGVMPIKIFFKNVWSLIDELKIKYSDKKILIITHNGVCRAIGAYFCGINEDGNLSVYSQKNCEIKEYNINFNENK